jgi:PAS domain S-box-containing protein
MALYWKILAPLAVVWLVLLGCVHWLWAPRAIVQEEMQYRDRVAGSLERLTRDLAPLLKEGRETAVAPLLDEALRSNPSWTALELRDRSGQSVRHTEVGHGRGANEREFAQPIIDGAVVLGWLAARVDLGPEFGTIRAGQREVTVLLTAGLAIALAVTALALRCFVARPLERLANAAQVLAAGGTARPPVTGGDDQLGRLSAGVVRLGEALAERTRATERELERCRAAEERLRESEERYTLAVRGADDGLWEWDLGADRVYYSPRWKSMLGYTEDEIGDRVDEWRGRIHADDLEPTLAALQAHLDGETARFENDHRLRHKNGRYRWVLARGATLRTAAGKPYRLVGLNTDITARKRAQEVLVSLAEGLALARGDDFFRSLVRNFAIVLGVKYAFIAECADFPATRVRKLASWKNDAWADANEFELAGTPCQETVSLGRVCVYKRDVGVIYPREVGFESYLGIPIFDSGGTVIGHLACYHTEPMQEDLPVQSIFSLFAVRAGVEMERRALEKRLERVRAGG